MATPPSRDERLYTPLPALSSPPIPAVAVSRVSSRKVLRHPHNLLETIPCRFPRPMGTFLATGVEPEAGVGEGLGLERPLVSDVDLLRLVLQGVRLGVAGEGAGRRRRRRQRWGGPGERLLRSRSELCRRWVWKDGVE